MKRCQPNNNNTSYSPMLIKKLHEGEKFQETFTEFILKALPHGNHSDRGAHTTKRRTMWQERWLNVSSQHSTPIEIKGRGDVAPLSLSTHSNHDNKRPSKGHSIFKTSLISSNRGSNCQIYLKISTRNSQHRINFTIIIHN